VPSRLQCLSRESGGRRNGGPTAGEQHGERSPCAGSPAVEGIPIFASTFPFAGERASADLGQLKGLPEGVSSPSTRPEPATMGCSSRFGGGEPLATSSCGVARGARGGPSLQAARPAQIHRHRFNPSLAQPRTGSQGRPQAALRRAVAVDSQPPGELAGAGWRVSMGSRGSLPVCLERGRLTQGMFLERESM
jgi:hypothetical protein